MNIDYSSILKIDRIRPDRVATGSMLEESENDLGKILFSPAFRRLQQLATFLPLNASRNAKSKLSCALQVAQVGRSIAKQVAAHLESENLATATDCAALVNITETACLTRDIGSAPFGPAGEAAIRHWFAEDGLGKARSACRTYGGRELDSSDPRLVNALADFYEFAGEPQGLRVLAKLQWNSDPRGLNLTKASIASTMRYLRMAGATNDESAEKFADRPGFFSTEAGLVKNVWSTFAYDSYQRRFPLSYIVEAADAIVSCISDLEEAIDADLLSRHEAIDTVKDAWLSSYIPVDPDPADDRILQMLTAAAKGKDTGGADFSFADLRRALIVALSDYTARRYLRQHEAVFAGTLDTLLSTESGAGAILATLKDYCRRNIHGLQAAQRDQLFGYSVIHGLLDHFGILLECPNAHFQIALDLSAARRTSDASLFIEQKLLALIPAEYRDAYSHLIAQLGNGRDAEFEEWNARAHLLVDYIAGLTESTAAETFKTLSGMDR